jgi:hypothetical protein
MSGSTSAGLAESVAEPGSKSTYGKVTTTNYRYSLQICINIIEILV